MRVPSVMQQASLVLAIFVGGCDSARPAKGGKSPRVIVTQPITGTVIDYQDFTGRLEAMESIEIRARVSGYVTKADFKEGDLVEKGKILYQIEEKPYLVDLDQVEANHKLALAERNLMMKNADRARRMMSTKSMSPEDYDAAMAALEKSAAQVGVIDAMKEKAKIGLAYTKVRSPIAGRVSRRYVDPGNLILADNTILTSVVSENLMHAYFDVDERTFLELKARAAAIGRHSDAAPSVPASLPPVMMSLSNEKEFERIGDLDFEDNRVVPTTGTVRMRGVFQNPSGVLKAGMFVRVRLPIGVAYQTTLIPDEAIQSDQERKYVWVVNDKNEVEYRAVKLGQSIKDLRVILPPTKGKEGKEGLANGDRVVVSGVQRVRAGSPVDPEDQPPPAMPDMPLLRALKTNRDR